MYPLLPKAKRPVQLSASQEEMRSAIMMVGKLVLAEGMLGITEASAIYNRSTP
jgi:hypothetical protein